MASFEQFNQNELQLLRESFLLVFKSIAGVDSKIDKKEQKAFLNVLEHSNAFDNELAKEILNEIRNNQDTIFENINDTDKEINSKLENIGKILDTKLSHEEAIDFKKLLIAIGAYIGESSGKWLDFKFSTDEEQKLIEIGRLLNTSTEAFISTSVIKEILKSIQ